MVSQPAQVYDSALKTLLEGQAADILSYFIAGIEVEEELSTEALKPVLRTDRVYRSRLGGVPAILHAELETAANSDMVYRMLEYFGILYRKYRKPIISVIIYPFRTSVPTSPLCIETEDGNVMMFHFRVICLWLLQAQEYLDKHAVCLFALLPTMGGATYAILSQALDEMKVYYGEDRRKLAEHLLLFDTFLQRTDTVSDQDKREVEEKLAMFDSLLEESRIVRKKAAEAEARGHAEGKVEGKIEGRAEGRVLGATEALRLTLVEIVGDRFPMLTEEARRCVAEIKEPIMLRWLIRKLSVAPDEKSARWLLDAQTAN